MKELTLSKFKNNEVETFELKEDAFHEGHFILLIKMKNAWVSYHTYSQCVFVMYKAHYPDMRLEGVETTMRIVSAYAKVPSNHYHDYTFVIQPKSYTRVMNNVFIPLISNVIQHLIEEKIASSQFKYLAEEFDCGVLLQEHELNIREITKEDVLFIVNF